MTRAVYCQNLTKIYADNAVPVHALRGVDFSMAAGEFVSLAGPSGSGKSTLLNLVGALDQPDSGRIEIAGRDITSMGARQQADLRLHHLGFVFQAYNLIPVLSALENVAFTMQLQGVSRSERESRARAALADLDMAGLEDRRPAEMSGGQQQRVAIARAIVTDPVLLLADEPSANLDSRTTQSLLQLLRTLNESRGITILTATHDPLVMGYARRHVTLRDGQIVGDESD